MKIKSFHIYSYALPYIRTMSLDKQPSLTRTGFICSILTDHGLEALGEIAPLPERSLINHEDTLAELLNLRQILNKKDIPGIFNEESLKAWFYPASPSPALRFGLEAACLHLVAQKNQTLPQFLLSETCAKKISVSGLLTGPIEILSQETAKLLDQGYTSFKLKVGTNLKDDLARVQTVLNITRGKTALHLDVNQAWRFEDALSFAAAFGPDKISYIEEPFQDTEKIPVFYDKTGFPVALDESLKLDHAPIHGAQIWVLKPSCVGGIINTLKLFAKARSSDRKVVISSSFESDVALSTLALLASVDPDHQLPAGLDTQKFYKKNLLKKAPHFKQGRIVVPEHNLTENDLDMSQLKII